MHRRTQLRAIALVSVLFSWEVIAMTAVPTRIVAWNKEETIAGEEFIAANESVVDYLATLQHPAGVTKPIRYDCMVKSRLIQPSLQAFGTTNLNGWVEVRMVYEVRDCVEAP